MDKLTYIVVGLFAVAFIGILVLALSHEPAETSERSEHSEQAEEREDDGIAVVPSMMAPGMPKIPGTGLSIVPGGF